MRLLFPALRKRSTSEDGFTLIEAVASLFMVSVVTLALTLSMLSGFRSLRETRLFQQATGIGNKEMEIARAVNFDDLSMIDADIDPANDSAGAIKTVCAGLSGNRFFDPDGSGPLKCEKIASTAEGGAITDHETTKTVGPTTFDVRRYVTWADSATQGGTRQDYKRYTVFIEWSSGGRDLVYQTSTLVTRTQRGLPVPKFQTTPTKQTRGVIPGNQVYFGHSVRNLGVIDTYDLTMEIPAGKSWTPTYYKDMDANGVYQSAIDTQVLTDSNGNGIPDTGSVATDASFYFLAVWNVAGGEPDASYNMTFTVTSGIDGAIFKSSQDILKVGTNTTILFLHNRPSPPVADTVSLGDLQMDINDPEATTLFKYSSDNGGQVGRRVNQGNTTIGESDKKKFVNWVFQVEELSKFQGTAVVNIWASVKDFHCDKNVEIIAYLRWKATETANSGTLMGTGNYTLPKDGAGCTGWRQIAINIPVTTLIEVPQNNYVELKVIVHDDVANHESGQFAYDTVSYPSTITLPQVFS